MTRLELLLLTIHTTIAFLLLWWLLFGLRRDYLVDKFRQDLFALRDELFDKAASGAITFDHPAYIILRTSMNGMIRFAHRVTFTHALLGYWILRGSDLDYHARLRAAMEAVEDPAVRKSLEQFHERMQILLANQLLKSSIPFQCMLMVLLQVLAIRGLSRAFLQWVSDRTPGLAFLEAEAELVGTA